MSGAVSCRLGPPCSAVCHQQVMGWQGSGDRGHPRGLALVLEQAISGYQGCRSGVAGTAEGSAGTAPTAPSDWEHLAILGGTGLHSNPFDTQQRAGACWPAGSPLQNPSVLEGAGGNLPGLEMPSYGSVWWMHGREMYSW